MESKDDKTQKSEPETSDNHTTSKRSARLRIIGRFAILAAIVIALNAALWLCFSYPRFTAIVVHHSASEGSNYKSIKEYHRKAHGWRDAAYHLILSNGKAGVPLGYLEATSRYKRLSYSLATRNRWCNLHAIHICIVGNYDKHPVPPELKPAIAHALKLLQQEFNIPDDRIMLHRDCSSSRCPGKYITKAKLKHWIKTLADKCPENIKRQQAAVIQNKRSPHRPTPRILVIISLSSFVLLLAAFIWLVYTVRSKEKKGEKDAGR